MSDYKKCDKCGTKTLSTVDYWVPGPFAHFIPAQLCISCYNIVNRAPRAQQV